MGIPARSFHASISQYRWVHFDQMHAFYGQQFSLTMLGGEDPLFWGWTRYENPGRWEFGSQAEPIHIYDWKGRLHIRYKKNGYNKVYEAALPATIDHFVTVFEMLQLPLYFKQQHITKALK